MNDLGKLRHLSEHWAEHNEDHAKTYRDWARRAEEMGKGELGRVLREIAEETERLTPLFRKALDLCA